MYNSTSGCHAADCPSLDGGPVSMSHEARMAPTASLKINQKQGLPVSSNSVKQSKPKKTGANVG